MPSLQTGLLLILKSFAVLHVLVAMFNDCLKKTISSDAESRKEQDGGKYSFVGRTTAELQAILQVYRNFMVSNTIVILLLLG